MNWFKKLRATFEEAPLYQAPILLLTEKQYIDVLENFYGRKLTKKELQKVSIKIEYQIFLMQSLSQRLKPRIQKEPYEKENR